MIPTIMTLEEFERQYAERSGVTVEWLHANNRFGAPCDCGEEGCEGWQMTHRVKLISIGNALTPPADLHIIGTVRCIEAERHIYGDVLDNERNSMLVLPLLDRFENQHVEITVRALESDDIKET